MLCYISGACTRALLKPILKLTGKSLEARIATYKDKLEKLEKAATGVMGKIKELEGKVDDTIGFLERELVIIDKWAVDADVVKGTLSTFSVEQLKRVAAFQEIFVTNVDDLEASAKAFLDQDAEIVF